MQNKRLIGAAVLVTGYSLLFINRGTMTRAVARALGGHTALIITNGLHVASELYRNPVIKMMLAGN